MLIDLLTYVCLDKTALISALGFIKKQSNTYQKNDVLDISDQNKEDENLIMIGGIAGEEVRKFGQNLKSFSEWKGEVNRVLKG